MTVDLVAGFGNKLWKELVETDSKDKTMKISSVQLAFTGIETAETGQKTIEGFLKGTTKRSREDDDDDDRQEAKISENQDDISKDATSFVCPRCSKRISIPTLKRGGEREMEQALGVMRVEHDDFHFAQDLAKASDKTNEVKSQMKSKRIRKEPEGIAKFFTKK